MQYISTAGVYHPDEATMDGRVIEIDDGEVVAVHDEVPTDTTAVYQTDGYAVPGLVDAHSHAPIRPGEGDQLSQMRADPAEQAARAVANLRRDLESGTTTMRTLGCEHGLDLRLAELERSGELASPRILPCGGHLTPTNGHGHALTATDGEADIRERIRQLVADGAHQVKYFATGGVSSTSGGLDRAPYSDIEVAAIVEEAHRQGVHVAAHAHGGAGAEQAIEAGVDTIEHAAALGEDEQATLERGDHHVVGTFTILHSPDGIERGDADDPAIMAKVEEARTRERSVWEALLARDIPVALGTDSMHGKLPEEVTHLVDLGASPERAIRAVTTEAARTARVEDEVGRLEPGLSADVVVVEDHPVKQPETLATPEAVFKRGERVV